MSCLKALYRYWIGPAYRPIRRGHVAVRTPALLVLTAYCSWNNQWPSAAIAGITTLFGAWRWYKLRS